MARKTVTWILIADGERARVLVNAGPGKGLEPATEPALTHALPPSRDIVADRPGRSQESATSARHAIEPRVDWHRHEKRLFAREIARMLEKNAAAKAFDRLILVAPPRTLGDLRAALPERLAATIAAELAKDLTHAPIEEIPRHLAGLIAL